MLILKHDISLGIFILHALYSKGNNHHNLLYVHLKHDIYLSIILHWWEYSCHCSCLSLNVTFLLAFSFKVQFVVREIAVIILCIFILSMTFHLAGAFKVLYIDGEVAITYWCHHFGIDGVCPSSSLVVEILTRKPDTVISESKLHILRQHIMNACVNLKDLQPTSQGSKSLTYS